MDRSIVWRLRNLLWPERKRLITFDQVGDRVTLIGFWDRPSTEDGPMVRTGK